MEVMLAQRSQLPLDLAAAESTLWLCKLPPSAEAEVSKRFSFG